jgi:hypothetical protein
VFNERFSSRHWLIFQNNAVAGCWCGFDADIDSDAGFGDSVVDHFAEAAIAEHLHQGATNDHEQAEAQASESAEDRQARAQQGSADPRPTEASG